jgi:hypothetical protein
MTVLTVGLTAIALYAVIAVLWLRYDSAKPDLTTTTAPDATPRDGEDR